MTTTVIIIGAGLSGLTTAYRLHQQGVSFKLLEARSRIGGRIHTAQTADGGNIEMGATWLGPKHTHLVALLKELRLEIFPQHIDQYAIYDAGLHQQPQLLAMPQQEPSYRIEGGTSQLIEALAKQIPQSSVALNTQAVSIEDLEGKIRVTTEQGEVWEAESVVSTLPPNLLVNQVAFTPELPAELLEIASQTHTWMGESIKAGVSFKSPFWKQGHGATLFSPEGPFTELYDHSNVAQGKYALKGFLNPAYSKFSAEKREALVWEQLRKCLGSKVDAERLQYIECLWSTEGTTYTAYSSPVMPHQNNSHPLYQKEFWEGKLYISGSETAAQFGGYMDGAVRAGERVAKQLVKAIA